MKPLARFSIHLSFVLFTCFTPRTGYAGGGLDPNKCSFPAKEFRGSDSETKAWLKNLNVVNAKIKKCKGLAFVSQQAGDRANWDVVCSAESTDKKYVMAIPAQIRESGKRYTIYNNTDGLTFGLDQLPTTKGAVGTAAYYAAVCNEKATVNFKVINCKNISFNPGDYGSGKTPQAFLIHGAADDCDKIANNLDLAGSRERLEKRKVISELRTCALR